MAGTQLFKNDGKNAHRRRYMSSEDNFSKGMQYTNTPLANEYAKAIINFDLKHDGTSLSPRGGLHNVAKNVLVKNISSEVLQDYDYFVHHSESTYIHYPDSENTELRNYFLMCRGAGENDFQQVSTASLVLELSEGTSYSVVPYGIPSTYASQYHPLTGKLLTKPAVQQMQGMVIDNPVSRDGVYTSLDGNTYVLVKTNSTTYKLGRIFIMNFGEPTGYRWWVEEVIPREVQPTQAMNYGYNMLKDNAYTFENTISATGAVQLTGIIPYSEQGRVLLTARPGTPMVFKLYYKYPQIDVDHTDERYKVQWEIQDLNSNSDAIVIQKVRNCPDIVPGQEISLAYTPSFKAFSIIVRLYKTSEIQAQDDAWERDPVLKTLVTKDANLTPNQVTTLASYYLTSNSDTSMLNVNPVDYDVCTAAGMCSWQQRLVMWGVNNAKNTLFVSEINDPSYIPYPNNCEIFSADIVSVVPYLASLLVFTTDALYKLTLNDDGLSYKTQCVQEKLVMQTYDANTIIAVQNMVFFKSGNYFYMMVPNNSLTSTVGIQLAPISRMVEQMLDELPKTLLDVLNEVYDLSIGGYRKGVTLELLDYNVHLDNTQVRNVYKVKAEYFEKQSTPTVRYFDISLNYDTVLRAWTVYTYQTTPYRDTVFKATVAGESIFTHISKAYELNSAQQVYEHHIKVSVIQADAQRPKDEVDLNENAEREFGNWQLIATGYRDFQEDLKKRFREVQFCINTLGSEVLKFNTAFTVDDVERVPMYRHIVTQITDKLDPDYGVIFIDRVLEADVDMQNTTRLNDWELDVSAFPELTVHKIRYKVSGKGYGGAAKILCKNDTPFELLHIIWVYRVMFAR